MQILWCVSSFQWHRPSILIQENALARLSHTPDRRWGWIRCAAGSSSSAPCRQSAAVSGCSGADEPTGSRGWAKRSAQSEPQLRRQGQPASLQQELCGKERQQEYNNTATTSTNKTPGKSSSKMLDSAQIHTSLPSVGWLTVDHETTFETDLPTWLQMWSETLPSGGQRAETPRRAFSYLQSLELSSMNKKNKEKLLEYYPEPRESRKRAFGSVERGFYLLFFDHLLIYFTFHTLGVSNRDKLLCPWGYGVIAAGWSRSRLGMHRCLEHVTRFLMSRIRPFQQTLVSVSQMVTKKNCLN